MLGIEEMARGRKVVETRADFTTADKRKVDVTMTFTGKHMLRICDRDWGIRGEK